MVKSVIAGKPIAVIALCFMAGACADQWRADPHPRHIPAGDAAVTVVSQADDPHSRGATYQRIVAAYRVGTGDRLRVTVFEQPDLTDEHTVDGLGQISMPLISAVPVGGRTTLEIERIIEDRLRRGFLRDPDVSVEVVTFRPFFILGQVQNGGQYPFISGMTVKNAIAMGGGYTPRANQGAVLVTRQTERGMETRKLDLDALVYPGDTIYVRERWF